MPLRFAAFSTIFLSNPLASFGPGANPGRVIPPSTRTKGNMRKRIIAAAVALAAVSVPSTASAASCGTRAFNFGRVTVTTAGATSCGFGWSSYHAFRQARLRTGHYPQSLRVKSPVTGKRYRLARVTQHVTLRRAYWRYTGVGAHGSTLDVRFRWRSY